MGEEARSLVGEAEEERRRNLAHNAKVLRLFAEFAAKNDSDYWRAYLNFINDFYRYVWRRLEEDPLFRETYMKILAERAKRPRREPPEGLACRRPSLPAGRRGDGHGGEPVADRRVAQAGLEREDSAAGCGPRGGGDRRRSSRSP